MNYIKTNLDSAYKQALDFAGSHYENFPVISFLIPRNLRKHIAIIYQFARNADDFADEDNLTSEIRIKKLNTFEKNFVEALKGNYKNNFWEALENTIRIFNLTPQYFSDLLTAFKQDIAQHSYETKQDLMNYCKYSANPVGRIILEFFDIRDAESFEYSDAICTALQLTNFYQDISIDYLKSRIYIPKEDMRKFGVTEKIFELKENNSNFKKLLNYEITETEKLFREGKKLLNKLPLKLKYEITWTILGGEKILRKIKKNNYNVFHRRPTLAKKDFIEIFFRSFISAE